MSTAAVHLDRLLEPFAGCLTPEIAAKLADLRADEAMQSRSTIWPIRPTKGC